MKKNRILTFSYPKDIRFSQTMRDDLKRELFDSDHLNDILFISGEVFTNFIRHTNSSHDSIFNFSVTLSLNEILLFYKYEDKSYSKLSIKTPDMSSYPSGGYGLFMIKKMASEFKINHSKKDNFLTLEIKICK